ncbi:ankyrin repeat-containing domain protein [Lactarius akahatsu]|uniref:Ankyrin repeat-containing domain protein n=1 Tax=Lactarius akahatsu TaxID=416441 RepID=A0AAD4LHF7_9AGAM|nr:ankyrin repeat-containing domain protein [Lactarius akahatsu]
MAEEDKTKTLNRLLIDSARTDNVDQLVKEVFSEVGKFDINYQDGIGNTALHYAAKEGSLDVLNELLEYYGCDVDYTNNIEGATPLHLAVKIEEPELRALIVDSLLDAGADPRIKDKEGHIAQDYVDENDKETLIAFRRHLAQESISKGDIAEDYDDDDEDFDGSGSDDEE